MQLQAGTLLQGGKYKIERVLGQGGFGITYLATQELFDRRVCIKEFFFKDYCERGAQGEVTSCTTNSKELVDRFLNKFIKEARTISRLDHPNIVRILDIFQENGTAYYAMEYIEGCSLADKANAQGALSEAVAVDYIKQVASALDYIHQRSINHLDVKPANIMVRQSDNKAILIDFGLSKQYDEQGGQTSTTPVGISHGYAPMEQYNAGGVSTFSPQTDIYSLGATLYKLVTGNTPPQAIEIFNEGLTGFPQSLSSNLVAAIKKTMQPKKGDRPQSIGEFTDLLGGQFAAIPNSSISSSNSDESTRIIGTSNSEPIKKPSSPQPTITKMGEAREKKGIGMSGMVIGIAIVCIAVFFLIGNGYNGDNNQSYSTSAPQQSAKQPTKQQTPQSAQQQPAQNNVSNQGTQTIPSEKKNLELKTIVDHFDSYINSNTRGWSLFSNFKGCNRTAGLEMDTKYLPFGCKYQGILLLDNKANSNSFGEAIEWDFILEGARVGADLLILKSYEPYNLDEYLKNRMKAKLLSEETLTFAWLELYSYKNSYILVHKYGGGSAGNDVEIHLGGDKSLMAAIATNIRDENIKFWQ